MFLILDGYEEFFKEARNQLSFEGIFSYPRSFWARYSCSDC